MYLRIPDAPLETDTAPNQDIMGPPATVGRGCSVELDVAQSRVKISAAF